MHSGFTGFSVDTDNQFFQSVDGVLYSKDLKTLHTYPQNKTDQTYTVLSSVEKIEPLAFCYNDYLETITIPDTVTQIGEYAFQYTLALKKVVLPNKLEVIEASLFYHSNIETIDIPSSVKTIKTYAFSFTNNLHTFNISRDSMLETIENFTFGYSSVPHFSIPKKLISIHPNAFMYADIEQFFIDEDHPIYKTVNGSVYSKDGKELIFYPPGAPHTHIMVSPLIEVIGPNAFKGVKNVQSIHVNNNIKAIGEGAFSYMGDLVEIKFSDGSQVKVLPPKLFEKSKITQFKIPASVVKIETEAFYGSKISWFFIPKTVQTISKNAFNAWTATKIYLEVEGDLDGYDENWAGGSTVVYDVSGVITDGGMVYVIGNQQAYLVEIADGYNNLDVVIPREILDYEVVLIGNDLFRDNEFIQTVSIPNTIKRIGSYAFHNTSLKKVVFEENSNLEQIEDHAFSSTKLTSITIPNSVEIIGWGAFSWTKFTSITIPNSVKEIGSSAFCDTPISTLIFEENTAIETIYSYAFYGTNLTTVTIPSTVTTLSSTAFDTDYMTAIHVDEDNLNYTSVDGVLYSKSKEEIYYYPKNKSGEIFKLPSEVKVINSNVFASKHLKHIYILHDVDYINDFAFNGAELNLYFSVTEKPSQWGEYFAHENVTIHWGYSE